MRILDLPQFACFRAQEAGVKVLRHRDSSRDLWQLFDSGTFEDYQNGQDWDVFGSAEFIISLIAERQRFARFVGVWRVLKKRKGPKGGFRYSTEVVPGFEELQGRLVVEWGEGARSWAQRLDGKGNKSVSEILPANYVMEFPGFYDLVLSYSQLQKLIHNPEPNREWHRMLSSVSGVYIILDSRTGNQYVGSAYGKDGIWGRWRAYAKNPSGGNKLLKELLTQRPNAATDLQFSILRVLEPGATKDDVLQQEILTKAKLGTRAFGLNDN